MNNINVNGRKIRYNNKQYSWNSYDVHSIRDKSGHNKINIQIKDNITLKSEIKKLKN